MFYFLLNTFSAFIYSSKDLNSYFALQMMILKFLESINHQMVTRLVTRVDLFSNSIIVIKVLIRQTNRD